MNEQETNPVHNEKIKDDLGDFLEKVFKLDQSNPERTNAQVCLNLLRQRESDFIGTDYEQEYWYAVSFEIFHLAQDAALSSDLQTAVLRLNECVAAAEKGFDQEWLFYTKGTLSYLNRDLIRLEECVSKAGSNSVVLARLQKGLKSRGTPNYPEDY